MRYIVSVFSCSPIELLDRSYFAHKSQWRVMTVALTIDNAIVAFATDREYRVVENVNLCDKYNYGVGEHKMKD